MDDRSVFDPAERRRVAEEMFRAALAPRIGPWIEEILSDPMVRGRIVRDLLQGQSLFGDAHELQRMVRASIRSRVSALADAAVKALCVRVDVDVSEEAPNG